MLTLLYRSIVLACLRHLSLPEFPELLDCPGAVTGIVIVGERQNLNLPLVNRLQNFDPLGLVNPKRRVSIRCASAGSP